MKTRKMIINAILLAIGALLHQITPALGLPIQPDFALTMLFIILMINDDYKTAFIAGIIIGIFTAMTTKFPGGQIPNMIDKIVTANLVFLILRGLKGRVKDTLTMGIVLPIGTLISGLIFLESASIIVGLPGSFTALFMAAVVPAMILNLIVGLILYRIVASSYKMYNRTDMM
ncbi:tryptophan transporter [Clostridium folliculivorans]|uniref:Tryptophan transporter n=1 Tax=Clostridium folliculivorans TaxID=2886038 RepID=A0A9W5Y2W3_9CLOT|nr:tryptophan transporter [Clostridium folliculivorans]GKU25734.1 tryptophan transporter [Clostridium folliculivorans]GKU28756.1 tryptophan transporter [Clostridium folliculivorans]